MPSPAEGFLFPSRLLPSLLEVGYGLENAWASRTKALGDSNCSSPGLIGVNLTFQLLTRQPRRWWVTHSPFEETIYLLSICMVHRQELTMTVKLPPCLSVKALDFSIQYGQANFPCVLHPESIPHEGKLLMVHNKAALI